MADTDSVGPPEAIMSGQEAFLKYGYPPKFLLSFIFYRLHASRCRMPTRHVLALTADTSWTMEDRAPMLQVELSAPAAKKAKVCRLLAPRANVDLLQVRHQRRGRRGRRPSRRQQRESDDALRCSDKDVLEQDASG